MYNINPNIPIDRIIYPMWMPNTPININFGSLNLPPQILQNMPYYASMAAKIISDKANMNPLRVFVFNSLAENNWGNAIFADLLNIIGSVISSNPNMDERNIYINVEKIVDHVTALIAKSYPNILNMIQPQIAQQVVGYLNSIGQPIQTQQTPMYNQVPSYPPQQQVPIYNGANTGFAVNSGSTQGFTPSTSSERSCRYNEPVKEVFPVDRSQHQMGIQPQAPYVSNARPATVKSDPTFEVNPNAVLLRVNVLDIGFPEEANFVTSFKELSDTVFSDNHKFFDEKGFDLRYFRVKDINYRTTLNEKQYKSFNDLVSNLSLFIKGDLSREKMKEILVKTDSRLTQFYRMLNAHLVSILNNIVSVNRMTQYVDNIISDLDDMLVKFESLGKTSVISEIREGLYNWMTKHIQFKQVENKDSNGAIVSDGHYVISLLITVIIIDADEDKFVTFSKNQLDFLSETRKTFLYIVTSDDVLYSVHSKSVERGENLVPYTVSSINKVGQLY